VAECAVHSRVVVLKERLRQRRVSVYYPWYTPRVASLHKIANSYLHVFAKMQGISFHISHLTHLVVCKLVA